MGGESCGLWHRFSGVAQHGDKGRSVGRRGGAGGIGANVTASVRWRGAAGGGGVVGWRGAYEPRDFVGGAGVKGRVVVP